MTPEEEVIRLRAESATLRRQLADALAQLAAAQQRLADLEQHTSVAAAVDTTTTAVRERRTPRGLLDSHPRRSRRTAWLHRYNVLALGIVIALVGLGAILLSMSLPPATNGASSSENGASSNGTITSSDANETVAASNENGNSATPSPASQAPADYLFGTLLTDGLHNQEEYAAGIRVAHLELGWEAYEPREGEFGDVNKPGSYAYEQRQKLQNLKAAGFHVVLGIGLQYPPAWVYEYPNSQYVNQYGDQANDANFTFNQALRSRAEKYIARVHADLGLNSFWAVRIGSGDNVEVLYPGMKFGEHRNSYWAFDPNAQEGVDLPPTISASPYPGWTPGERTWNGKEFSTEQVEQWYDWYLGALVDGVDWQIRSYKQQGFTGYLQVLMPGLGSRPREYDEAIANYLDGTGDSNDTMGRGAAWHKVIERIADKKNVVVYVSSVADGSGDDNLCEAGDRDVELTDRLVALWSATRWISYNADRFGLAKMGENPGRGDSPNYGKEMMARAVDQMKACGFQGLMWAHQPDLYDPESGVTLQDYATLIAQSHGTSE